MKRTYSEFNIRRRICDQLVEEMDNLVDVIDVTILVFVANVVSSMIN